MRRDRDEAVAVAIHDVEPATYTRAALIRDWLDDHGIDRVTLLVVPAPDLHPFSTRAPSSRSGCWSARTGATRSRSTASRAARRSSPGWTRRRRAARSTPGGAC